MDDIRHLFADKFLHCVDSDSILVCEVFDVAEKTAASLESPDLKTPKATSIIEELSEDPQTNNVTVKLRQDDDSYHTLTLQTKTTRNNTIDKIKRDLATVKAGGLLMIKP